ncbi:hypothetical protein P4E94_16700 [Pontiellaceae bacterium B12219]|nr:hypothetical protein [Pontiellaceae bacterium B12219]
MPVDIDIMFAEVPGGQFNAFLCVMEEDVKYENNTKGEPILPLFKTAALPRSLQDMIYRGMPFGEICVTNGPVFNDYGSGGSRAVVGEAEKQSSEKPVAEKSVNSGSMLRTWHSNDGAPMEAEFVTAMADYVVLKTARGQQKKIPVENFSDDDRRFIELATPPRTLSWIWARKSDSAN